VKDYLRDPTHCTVSDFWADLTATLDAFDLTHVLSEHLAQPTLGHPEYAERRRQSRILTLRSTLVVLEQHTELEERAAA
jgi:hypothetical protein